MEPEKDMFEEWQEERESSPFLKRKLESISLWWKFDGRYLIKEFVRGVENIWYWLPIIWKDRNWDDSFIFTILSHKLKAQSKYIGERNMHTRAKRDSEVMMTCVRLIEKIQNEFYNLEYADYHKTKDWFEPVEGVNGYKWKSKQVYENFDVYFKKYPLIYKRVLNGEGFFKLKDQDDKEKIAMNISQINHDRARKLLFKLMERNIEGWWD